MDVLQVVLPQPLLYDALLLRADAEVRDTELARGSTSEDQDGRIGQRRERTPRVTAHISVARVRGVTYVESTRGKEREEGLVGASGERTVGLAGIGFAPGGGIGGGWRCGWTYRARRV
jgi:hypothetical protein